MFKLPLRMQRYGELHLTYDQCTKKWVFSCYIWYVLAVLEALKQFYFITNKKYRSFLKFWVPSQLHTTKSRFCGSSQSSPRNQISEGSDAFWCIWRNLKISFLRELCEQPQRRDFVLRNWKGTQMTGMIYTFCLE